MPADRKNRSSPLIEGFKKIYLNARFFQVGVGYIVLFLLCFIFDNFLNVALFLLWLFLPVLIVEAFLLFGMGKRLEGQRITPERLSNGEENNIEILIRNLYPFNIDVTIIDELPFQLQIRDFSVQKIIAKGKEESITYQIRPTERGKYEFGGINVYVSSPLGLLQHRYTFSKNIMVPVYPAFLNIKKYELLAVSNRLNEIGVKLMRRIGHASEFEHIKPYVIGDDPRTINYKATARVNKLMVNSYQEEKSQQIYCLIDKGRTMQMPFNGLTLLDYAINSCVMVSSTALNKGDKVGLITFSNKIDQVLAAEKHQQQRNKIAEVLYAQTSEFKEADYERLYVTVRQKITQRSLLVFYTNFETLNGMRRQRDFLVRMAKNHLILVAFFLNSEFQEILENDIYTEEDAIRKGIGEKLIYDKYLIVKELNRYGIQTVLTTPENLTINTMNKYLELKRRGMI